MKKRISKVFIVLLIIVSGFMEISWRLFHMMICCKRGAPKKERKKWFELSHIRENHPQNGYEKEYHESKNGALPRRWRTAISEVWMG